MKLDEIADRITAHLRRFEADVTGANKPYVVRGPKSPRDDMMLSHYFHAGAYRFGNRVEVLYVAYQRPTYLKRTDAETYLAWLDAGNEGRHFEAFARPVAAVKEEQGS